MRASRGDGHEFGYDAAMDGTAAPSPRSQRRSWVAVVRLSLVLAFLANTLANSCYSVLHSASAAMEPTIGRDDALLVNDFTYGVILPYHDFRWSTRTPDRGDVIAFRVARIGSPPATAMRVIGLPGETVSVSAGAVSVNGVQLRPAPELPEGTWTVAPDHVFVLGDNRSGTGDSYKSAADGFGQVALNEIMGRVEAIVFKSRGRLLTSLR